jgi:hypothetical protein
MEEYDNFHSLAVTFLPIRFLLSISSLLVLRYSRRGGSSPKTEIAHLTPAPKEDYTPLQGGIIHIFSLKMATTIFVETLNDFQ